ncbi:hypothetical protein GN958_ATG17158 [Phytophthora infestans]|uniref:HTH CENPB-type domain-containing protein n=1 Tax=Phytophthora infestans TaxID=4787 RepID=A0A8S9TYJ7_PHYIN|nr:hypothetical protein GN958_ATG17158 [Phytophthora infestans]
MTEAILGLLGAKTQTWIQRKQPCITGNGKRWKQIKRVAVAYGDKKAVLEYLDEGHTVKECITHFHGELQRKEYRAKAKLVSKWRKAASSIRAACASGRSRHLNTRERGVGTVLNKAAEEKIEQWVNSFRKEGVPVSPLCSGLKPKMLLQSAVSVLTSLLQLRRG